MDGDTIKVIYNGKKDTVRYLLVDTPETKKPNSCVQPYGEDASKRNKELVNSGESQLEFDKGDRRDKYGRLLAYVYVDGKSVQETLLKEGLARVAYVYEPNTKYIDQFRLDEQEAKSENVQSGAGMDMWLIEDLMAVWNRKTLGLNKQQQSRMQL